MQELLGNKSFIRPVTVSLHVFQSESLLRMVGKVLAFISVKIEGDKLVNCRGEMRVVLLTKSSARCIYYYHCSMQWCHKTRIEKIREYI